MYDFQCFTDDFVEIGGASNLDPTLMEVKESFCGHQPAPAKMVRDKTIFPTFHGWCDSSLCGFL